jgi:hypothetical protein
VDLSFVRKRVKRLYSSIGRPLEVLLRLPLVGYPFGFLRQHGGHTNLPFQQVFTR